MTHWQTQNTAELLHCESPEMQQNGRAVMSHAEWAATKPEDTVRMHAHCTNRWGAGGGGVMSPFIRQIALNEVWRALLLRPAVGGHILLLK